MGWLGAAASLAGSVIGAISQNKTNKANRSASMDVTERQAELNKDYAMWSAVDLPAMNRLGMTKAGFNPILAITNGTGTQGNVSAFPYTQDSPLSSVASGLSSAYQAYRQERLDEASLEHVAAQDKLLEAQTLKTMAEASAPRNTIGQYIERFFKSSTGKELMQIFKDNSQKRYKPVNVKTQIINGSPVGVNSATGIYSPDGLRSNYVPQMLPGEY